MNLRAAKVWLSGWLLRQMPSCQEVVRLVSEGMDRPLTWRQRLTIYLHLPLCGWCARYQKQLSFMRRTMRGYAGELLSSGGTPPNASAEGAKESPVDAKAIQERARRQSGAHAERNGTPRSLRLSDEARERLRQSLQKN
ncbi:MAG: hypothetical protein R3282_00740 [Rhodothermales bacterium]|nr:hypothetical protein [Rhodothermales bacterium]